MNPDVEWDRRARALEFNSLEDVREWAKQWRAGVSALTGAAGIGLFLKSSDTFGALPIAARSILFGAVLTGFLSIVASSVLAIRASTGEPASVRNGGRALRAWTVSEIHRTQRLMWWSKGLAFCGLVLIVASVTTSWLWPPEGVEQPSAPPSIVVLNASDWTSCDYDQVLNHVDETDRTASDAQPPDIFIINGVCPD